MNSVISEFLLSSGKAFTKLISAYSTTEINGMFNVKYKFKTKLSGNLTLNIDFLEIKLDQKCFASELTRMHCEEFQKY